MSRRLLLALLHLGMAALPLLMLWPLPLPPGATLLDTATFSVPGGRGGDAALPVTLPHNWRDGSADDATRGRYTLQVPVVDAGALPALFLPRHRFVAEVSIDGQVVGRTGRTVPPISRQHFTPALITLPPAALQAAAGVVQVDLVSDPPGLGFLAPPVFGPEAALAPLLRRQVLLDITVPLQLAAGVAAMGLVIGVLAVLRAAEPGWGWFACLCLALACSMSNRFVTDPPVPVWAWERFVFLAAFWAALAGLGFALTFNEERQRLVGLLLCGAAVTLGMVLLPFAQFMAVAQYVLTPGTILLAVVALVLLLRAARPDMSAEPLFFTLPAAAIVAAAAHDALMVLNLVQQRLEYLLPFASTTLVGGMALLLVHRLVTQTRSLARMNRALEERLAARELALEESFRRREGAEKRASALQERAQLTRDLHDGLGSRLLSLRHLAERRADHADLLEAAAETLRELRLIATPLRNDMATLGSLLGQFREERLRPLERRGLAVRWRVDETRDPPAFGPAMAVELQRFLHEALANALRHGSGNDISVALREEDRGLVLDLGNSVDPTRGSALPGAGTGLDGMAERAARTGAAFAAGVEDGHWHVRLTWCRA